MKGGKPKYKYTERKIYVKVAEVLADPKKTYTSAVPFTGKWHFTFFVNKLVAAENYYEINTDSCLTDMQVAEDFVRVLREAGKDVRGFELVQKMPAAAAFIGEPGQVATTDTKHNIY